MSILDRLSSNFRVDVVEEPSTEESIEKLKEFSPIEGPQDYLDIIRHGKDAEVFVILDHEDFDMYLRFIGAEDALEQNEGLDLEDLPNSLVIGDNEGGRAIVYTTGPEGFGVYLVDFGALFIDEATYIAPSLEDLMTKNIGIENLTK